MRSEKSLKGASWADLVVVSHDAVLSNTNRQDHGRRSHGRSLPDAYYRLAETTNPPGFAVVAGDSVSIDLIAPQDDLNSHPGEQNAGLQWSKDLRTRGGSGRTGLVDRSEEAKTSRRQNKAYTAFPLGFETTRFAVL